MQDPSENTLGVIKAIITGLKTPYIDLYVSLWSLYAL